MGTSNCVECDEPVRYDMKPREVLCFKHKIKHVSLGFTMGKEDFHGPTVGERQKQIVADAAAAGRTIEPYGQRWI